MSDELGLPKMPAGTVTVSKFAPEQVTFTPEQEWVWQALLAVFAPASTNEQAYREG